MSKISDEVCEFLTPIVKSLGCEIIEVEFAKKQNGDNLTIFIDKPDGVTLDDCERVHNAIDAPLDELNPTSDKPYTLNVSSLGLDRPIETDRDFERNIGEVLEIKLFKAIEKKKNYIGTLTEFSKDEVKLVLEGNHEVVLDRKLIAKATKYIDF